MAEDPEETFTFTYRGIASFCQTTSIMSLPSSGYGPFSEYQASPNSPACLLSVSHMAHSTPTSIWHCRVSSTIPSEHASNHKGKKPAGNHTLIKTTVAESTRNPTGHFRLNFCKTPSPVLMSYFKVKAKTVPVLLTSHFPLSRISWLLWCLDLSTCSLLPFQFLFSFAPISLVHAYVL